MVRRTEASAIGISKTHTLHDLVRRASNVPLEQREEFLREECHDERDRSQLEELIVAVHEGSGVFQTPDVRSSYLDSFARAVEPSREKDDRAHTRGDKGRQDPYRFVGQTISHYEIVSVLGAGSMGVVYKAIDTRLNRTVALKFLPPTLSRVDEARHQFINEARAISALQHENILTLYDIGELDDLVFLSMAYCEGETLLNRLDAGALPLEEATEIAVQISRGLAAAHRRGIVHRDVKPANVMITPAGKVKLLDFGLAQIKDQNISRTDAVAGTPLYMAPEQVRGDLVDHRSDIWALGVTFYEMLTGRPPFDGDYPHAVIYSIMYRDPDFGALPPDVQPLLRSMLAKDPAVRPQSAEEVETLLRANEPTERRPDRRSIRSYIPIAAGAAVVLAGLIAWFAWSGKSTAVATGEYVMVADFANHTGEQVLDHSLTEAIRVALRQSRHIDLLSPSQVQDALERMRLPGDHPIDEETSVQIARREGVRLVMAGAVDRLGSSYVLTSKIIESSTGETLRMRRVEVERIERILEGVDRLTREVRADLGESLSMISASSKPMDRVTTSSIQALELHGRANQLYLEGRIDEAARLNERAVEIDSTFAVAISDLSSMYRRMGEDEKALQYHRRIPTLLDQVGDRERFMILATYYGPRFEMDYEAAYDNASHWVEMYPRDEEAHAWKGHMAMHLGRTAEAIRSNQQASVLDTTYTGVMLGNNAFAQAMDGRAREALNLFRISRKYRPENAALPGFIAQSHWMGMAFDSAETAFRSVLPNADPLRRKKTHGHLAALYLFEGKLNAASEQIESAIVECRRTDDAAGEAYFQVLAGEVERRRGETGAAVARFARAILLSEVPHVDAALAGAAAAELGRIDHARTTLTRIRGADSDDPHFTKRKASLGHFVNAGIAAAEGDRAAALDHLEQIEEIHRGDPIYLLSKVRRADLLADAREAEREYLEILQRRGEAVMAYLPGVRDGGSWTSRLWPETHLALGRLKARENQRADAVDHLRKAVHIWRDADAVHVGASEARTLLHRIENQSTTTLH